MSAWQPGRAKGPLLALAGLACSVALLDLGVSAVVGWDTFREGEPTQTFSRLEEATSKALALENAGRRRQHYGLIVGMSTAKQGIGLRQLEQETQGLRWAKITGEFSSFVNQLQVVRRLDRPGLRPERTLLCVHYGMLLGSEQHRGNRTIRWAEIAERTARTRSPHEVARLISLAWLGNNRRDAANYFEIELGARRAQLLGAFGQAPEIILPAVADPFEDTVNRQKRMHPSVRERHVRRHQELWQQAQSSQGQLGESAQLAAASEILTILGAHPGLVVVLMPEHSTLRAVQPEAFARRLLDSALSTAKVAYDVPVLDLRASVPDEYFADEAHASAEGRAKLTTSLARALAEASLAR